MTQDTNPIPDALGALARLGSMGQKELMQLIPALRSAHFTTMERSGLIRIDRNYLDACSITRAGKRHIGATADRKTAPSRSVTTLGNGHYDGRELRPFEGRPGSMDAFALPSRMVDGLRFRDGKVVKEVAP